MQKSVYCFLAMLAFWSAIPLATASIAVDPLQAVYNIGDDMAIGFTVTRASGANGFLVATLECAEGSSEIYKTPLRSSAGEQKKILIPVKLDRFIVGNLSKGCAVMIAYGDETGRSTGFEISSEVFVLATVQEVTVQPGSSVFITGSAAKKNGRAVEGILDIAVAGLNVSASVPIKGGVFNLTLPVASRASAQTYLINVRASERDDSGLQSNEGQTTLSFRVPQVLTTYEIALERASLSPPATLEYRILAYDQAEAPMALESSITLRSPAGTSVTSELVAVGVPRQWAFAGNATPGIWSLDAQTGDARRSKQITMQEVRNITFALENDTLIVRNVGNVPYAESVAVRIGDEPKAVPVQLSVGESVRLKLFAPKGDHEVRVDAANASVAFGRVFLTGNSIDVRNADSRSWKSLLWVWWMLAILIAAAVALQFYRKFGRRASWGKTSHGTSESSVPVRAHATHSFTLPESLQGTKEECTIVAVHTKNLASIKGADSPAAQTLARITAAASAAGAAAYTQGACKILIFTPAVENPERAAIRLARDIERVMTEHNRQYALKIHAGIGISKGPMIIETQEGKPKFTSVGTTVVGTKSLAERAAHATASLDSSAIFVSDELYRSLIGKIKVEKVNEKTWKLRGQGGVSRNAEFLKRLYEQRS